jgi:two-component system sensor kinase FixL
MKVVRQASYPLFSDPRPGPYLVAAGAVAATFVLRLSLGETFTAASSFLLFIPAVLVSAALGGLICGLFATVFASLAVGMVTRDDPQNLVGALSGVLFLLVGIGMAIGGGWFHAARRRAAATNAHLQSILDTVPDAVVVIDRAGVMTSFSPAAERLFGWTADEAIGQNVSLLMPESARARVTTAISTATP